MRTRTEAKMHLALKQIALAGAAIEGLPACRFKKDAQALLNRASSAVVFAAFSEDEPDPNVGTLPS